MNTVALHQNRIEKVLGSLSVEEMVWAMKFLTEKLASCLKAGTSKTLVDERELERAKTQKFLDSICGKWEDDKDADEMVKDIYASRVNKDYTELERIFES